MADHSEVAGDLLRGAAAIAVELYGSDGNKEVRRVYHEQKRWPIFRLDEKGILYALRSALRSHVAAKAALAAALKAPKAPQNPRRRQRKAATSQITNTAA